MSGGPAIGAGGGVVGSGKGRGVPLIDRLEIPPPSKSNIDPGGEVEGRSISTDEGPPKGPPKGPVVPVPPKPCNKEAKSSCGIGSRTRSSLSQGV